MTPTFTLWWRHLCRWQFVVLLLIYTYLGLTTSSGPHIPQYNDKVMHFIGYAVAGLSITFALPSQHGWQRLMWLVVFSTAIEVGQHFNPPRTFSLGDIAANLTGALLGLALMGALRRWLPHLSHCLINGSAPERTE